MPQTDIKVNKQNIPLKIEAANDETIDVVEFYQKIHKMRIKIAKRSVLWSSTNSETLFSAEVKL